MLADPKAVDAAVRFVNLVLGALRVWWQGFAHAHDPVARYTVRACRSRSSKVKALHSDSVSSAAKKSR